MTSFVDAETFLIAALAEQFPDARVLAVLPADLEGVLPVVQVERIGGSDDYGIDNPLIDVECFASDRVAAKALADQVRSFLRYGLMGRSSMGAVVLNVLTSSGPAWRPYGNTNVSRVGATYAVTLHNQF